MPRQKEIKFRYCVVISNMTAQYKYSEMPHDYFISNGKHYEEFVNLHDAIAHCLKFPESFTRKIYKSDMTHIDYRETSEYEIQYSF